MRSSASLGGEGEDEGEGEGEGEGKGEGKGEGEVTSLHVDTGRLVGGPMMNGV